MSISRHIVSAAVAALLGFCLCSGAFAQTISRIDHFAIMVRSIEASANWYKKVFDLEPIQKWSNAWMIGRDQIRIGLFVAPPDAVPISDLEKTIAIQHVAFTADDAAFTAFKTKLDGLHISYELEDIGIAESLFLSDLDGHKIEIIRYK